MAFNFLQEIIQYKKHKIQKDKELLPLSSLKKEITPYKSNNFFKQFNNSLRYNIIAEIKKASPSKGLIRKDFDPVQIAKVYEKNKVTAISVLTEDKYFQGNTAYLKMISKKVNTPLLRKDFIIDPYQIYESILINAQAFLLIGEILSKSQITDFIQLANELNLGYIVEVHSRPVLEKVLKTPAKMIGINNRNLETFKVDINTTLDLAADIPADKIIICESGIHKIHDIKKLLILSNLKGFLIGEALMRSVNIAEKVKYFQQLA